MIKAPKGQRVTLLILFLLSTLPLFSNIAQRPHTQTETTPTTDSLIIKPLIGITSMQWDTLPGTVSLMSRQQTTLQNFMLLKSSSHDTKTNWQTYANEHNHSYSLKFQAPHYPVIEPNGKYLQENYLPQNNPTRLYNYQNTQENQNLSRSIIEKINDSLMVYNPSLVRWDWKKIPAPHRIVLDGVLLDKKAAQEAFRVTYVEPPRKVAKPRLEKKRWNYGGSEALQLSEAFFDNWVKGGENSISVLSDLRVNANYKHNKIEWDNKLLHKLGIISQQEQRTRINDDVIQMTSKLGVNASKKWYYSALLDFKTQFFYGRDAKDYSKILSGFMSPGYQTFAIGMDYKRSKDFTVLISPLTSKVTYVLDTVNVDPGRYNIPEGQRSDAKTGLSVTSAITAKVSHELTITSNLDYFYSYLDDEGKSQLEWEVILNMRINKYLSARLIPHIRYYQNESENVQFKQNLTIAFNYTF